MKIKILLTALFANIASAANPPIPTCAPCEIIFYPAFQTNSRINAVVSPPKKIRNQYLITVTFTPKPPFDGFYLPKCHNLMGDNPPILPFPGIIQPESRQRTYLLNAGQRIPISPSFFYLKYDDPCTNSTLIQNVPDLSPITDTFWLVAPPAEPVIPEEPEEGDPIGGGGIPKPPNEPPVPPPVDPNDNPVEDPCKPTQINEQCEPYENIDDREAPLLNEVDFVSFISENIDFQHRKRGFDPYVTPDPNPIPKFFLEEFAETNLVGGNPESPVGGEQTLTVCRMTGEVATHRIGNPSYYGPTDDENVTVEETTLSGSYPVKDYDDCPNEEDDEPAQMLFSAELSNEYTTEMLHDDVIGNIWEFKDYYSNTSPVAMYDITNDKTTIQYGKSRYKVKLPEKYPSEYRQFWMETFLPEDENITDEEYPEEEVSKYVSEEITSHESKAFTMDPADENFKEGGWNARLIEIEPDLLSKDNETGELRSLSNVPEAIPLPDIDIRSTNVTRLANGKFRVDVELYYRDLYGELPGSTPNPQLIFTMNGEVVWGIQNLQATPASSPPWQARNTERIFNEWFETDLINGVNTLNVKSMRNFAGDFSYDTSTIVCPSPLPSTAVNEQQVVPEGLFPQITIPANFDLLVNDSVTVKYGAISSNLIESEKNSNLFTGQITLDSGIHDYKLEIKRSVASVNGNDQYLMSTAHIKDVGVFDMFSVKGSTAANYSTAEVVPDNQAYGQTSPAQASKANSISKFATVGDVSAFIVRLRVPRLVAEDLEDGKLSLLINGQTVTASRNEEFEDTILQPSNPDYPYIYVMDGGSPKLFAISNGDPSAMNASNIYLLDSLKLKIQEGVKLLWEYEYTVDNIEQVAPPLPSAAPVTTYEEEVFAFYEFFYLEYGQSLLNKARNDFNLNIEFKKIKTWGEWDLDGYTHLAEQMGVRPNLIIHKREGQAANGAIALFEALSHFYGSGYSGYSGPTDKPPLTIPPGMDAETAALYEFLSQGRWDQFGEFMGDFAEAGKMGLSMISGPFDIVISISDSGDLASQGKKGQAALNLGLMLVPGTLERARHFAKPVRLRVNGRSFTIPKFNNPNIYLALKKLRPKAPSKVGDRVLCMRELKPFIDSGEVTARQIEDLWDMGLLPGSKAIKGASRPIVVDPYKILEEGLRNKVPPEIKPTPRNRYRTHHDFPLDNRGFGDLNIELELLKRGIDPNDANLGGRFLGERFHTNVIHGGKSNAEFASHGGAWNYQWFRYFRQYPNANAADIMAFKNYLVAITPDNGTLLSVWDVDWKYLPE
jgi:hypothetical protein